MTRLLPDAVHQVVKPETAVVRLQTTHDRRGVLDGAWWPCSRDIAAELPALVAALTDYLAPVTRVGLDAGAWDALPTRLLVGDRVVHIGSFPVGDDTVLVTRGHQDHFALLMVPPQRRPRRDVPRWPKPSAPTTSHRPNRSSSTPAPTGQLRRGASVVAR